MFEWRMKEIQLIEMLIDAAEVTQQISHFFLAS